MDPSIGQPIRRKEDHRLLTGRGEFSDDHGADGQTHAGAFDVTYLSCLPDFVVMAAADEAPPAEAPTSRQGTRWHRRRGHRAEPRGR